MNENREYLLNNSLRVDDGDETRSQTPHVTTAGLTARQPRSTPGSARRNLVRTAVTSAILAMGIVGVGVVGVAGDASARPPRDTTNNGTCTKINQAIRIENNLQAELYKEQLKVEARMTSNTGTPAANARDWNRIRDFVDASSATLKGLKDQKRANGC